MNTDTFIFQTTPKVLFATNTFVNVPIILKYEDVNLIEIVKEAQLGFTTQIPIYHSDGTYIAKVKGMRLFPTEHGKKVGLTIDKYKGLWVCKMNNQILFEVQQQTGDSFKATAELFTPDGYFVKCTSDLSLNSINTDGPLKIGGLTMSGNTFMGCKIGIWVKKNGSFMIGVNG